MALQEDDNLYVKKDLLDHANLDAVTADDGRHRNPGRKTVLAQALGKDEDEIEEIREGGYQGTILFVFRHANSLWLLKDDYGSCSHCDGMLAAVDHDDYAKYVRGMCNNAYAFESVEDARSFLAKRRDSGKTMRTFAYGWGPLVDGGLDAIEAA